MNPACRIFREQLAGALRGQVSSAGLFALSWHEHLRVCVRCRAELEEEQALDLLLATLPEPRLPADLALQVLQRLERERPAVLGSTGGRDVELERWLERAGEVHVPPGLGTSLLRDLRKYRGTRRRFAAPRRAVGLAAGVLAAALVGWMLWRGQADPQDDRSAPNTPSEPEAGLIASLELLQSWDLLVDEDLDLQLAAIDLADELLLEAEPRTEQAAEGRGDGQGDASEQERDE